MKVIDAITPLLVESRLFEDPERVKHSAGSSHRKRKSNLTHMGLKIGQGGTLDPLADGVLGMSYNLRSRERDRKGADDSNGCKQGYEALGEVYRVFQSESKMFEGGGADGRNTRL
jgi:tRNA pseudouridine55 synthase